MYKGKMPSAWASGAPLPGPPGQNQVIDVFKEVMRGKMSWLSVPRRCGLGKEVALGDRAWPFLSPSP